MTGPCNFETNMAVLKCPIDSLLFSYQIRIVRGHVKRREGRLGLLLGLVFSLEEYFRRISIFFVFFMAVNSASPSATLNEIGLHSAAHGTRYRPSIN